MGRRNCPNKVQKHNSGHKPKVIIQGTGPGTPHCEIVGQIPCQMGLPFVTAPLFWLEGRAWFFGLRPSSRDHLCQVGPIYAPQSGRAGPAHQNIEFCGFWLIWTAHFCTIGPIEIPQTCCAGQAQCPQRWRFSAWFVKHVNCIMHLWAFWPGIQ